MMRHMPAIPESTRSSIIVRLLDHAEKNWPQLAKVRARYHGSFAYITGVLRDGEQIPLFRLRYGGSAHSLRFSQRLSVDHLVRKSDLSRACL
jgi:hypothetical protein